MNTPHVSFKSESSLDHIGHSMSMPHETNLEQECPKRVFQGGQLLIDKFIQSRSVIMFARLLYTIISLWTNTFSYWDKYICNLDKYLFWDALALG